MTFIKLIIVIGVFIATACNENDTVIADNTVVPETETGTISCEAELKFSTSNRVDPKVGQRNWLIPQNQVRDGGPGKDGIPSIDKPRFTDAESVDFLTAEDLVIGIRVGEEIRAYPHPILDWHEIVNDKLCDLNIAVTYCPLTGTAIGWNRTIDGVATTFGVSGSLYNTNLIPYDRKTDSNWSQMRMDCVEGTLQGTNVEVFPLVETSWTTFRSLYPKAKVLNTNTDFSRPYNRYPYGDYKTSDALIFPVNNEDNRLPKKERVLGIVVEDAVKAYRFVSFREKRIVQEQINGLDIVVLGSEEDNYLVAHESSLSDGTKLTFQVSDEQGIIATDQLGNKWDIFGYAVVGPNQGEQLLPTRSYIGYFFSWAAFYPQIDIFES